MSLPVFQDQNQNLMLIQRNWKSKLDPVLKSSILNGKQLMNVALRQGSTTIPHGLGQTQTGWFLTDIQGSANVYRSESFNKTNLILTSTVAVTVSIWVY